MVQEEKCIQKFLSLPSEFTLVRILKACAVTAAQEILRPGYNMVLIMPRLQVQSSIWAIHLGVKLNYSCGSLPTLKFFFALLCLSRRGESFGGLLSGFLRPQEKGSSSGTGQGLLLPPLQNGCSSEVQLPCNVQNQVCLHPSTESKI